MITQKRLRELLHYDPLTGVFTWRQSNSARALVGAIAGSKARGYVWIRCDGQLCAAHRLAWLYMTGLLPKQEIDHKNGMKDDNRWSNLREATRKLNMQNERRARINNKTGYLGVRPHGKRFQARVKLDGRIHYFGSFGTPEQAHAAYVVGKRSLHPWCTI